MDQLKKDSVQPFIVLSLFTLLIITSCKAEKEKDKKFTLLAPDSTNITFKNSVKNTSEFNTLNYLYFYDGGGVAAGDINNDGLPDLFFVGNETKNRLYLNKGNFRFEDITENAGVGGSPGSWSTGATMADVDGDGYLDIYVCQVNYLNKWGTNQLFINNGDGTFKEKAAEYGLDFAGYSTQAAFFDYNDSGRLDLFLLNHSHHSDSTFGRAEALRKIYDPKAGDRLFRNDGDQFIDVTQQARIHSSALGYGLGIAISDINKDGWPDIYIGNDFHEDDYLYLNNGDGTFQETLYSIVGHTSASSMGNDIADVNNDGNVDIVSVDMMPEDQETYMRSGGPDLYKLYQAKIDYGFGHKNARNTLQINNGLDPDGNPFFSEIAFTSGVAKTDWSWASLFTDLNNNGFKDLFVTNGIVRRSNDLDFLRNFYGEMDEEGNRTQLEEVSEEMMELIETMPQTKVSNYAFRNNGDLTFTNRAEEWGLDQPSFSSGAAYVDLNNDGFLDLVVNNVNMRSFIYRNNGTNGGAANYLKVDLNGDGKNTSGLGSKVILYDEDQVFYQEQMPTRGFQSSVDHTLHFGLGDIKNVDSLVVVWPDRSYQVLDNLEVNQLIRIDQQGASGIFDYSRLHGNWKKSHFRNVTDDVRLEYKHRENDFNDFDREPLMPYKLSTQGPALAVGDISGNGLDDIYLGGAAGQTGKLFLQQTNGNFRSSSSNRPVFALDQESEDIDAIFFDANGDKVLDLYVVSGGGEYTGFDTRLEDRLYINQGNGKFKKSYRGLPEMNVNGSVVRSADFNNDGSVDLFIGGRSVPFGYGKSPRSFLLANDGSGTFRDVTEQIAPELKSIGMVTDAQWAHISNQQYPDLVVAGEWMPIELFQNDGNSLVKKTEASSLSDFSGLWQTIRINDLNNDGLLDLIAGNFGTNSRIQASAEQPLKLYVNDFIDMGQTVPLIATKRNENYYPIEQLDEMILQFRRGQDNSYEEYAAQTVKDLFSQEVIESALQKEIKKLESSIFLNNGDGTFIQKDLPIETQIAPVMTIYTVEPEQDNRKKDILFGGNLYDVKPSMGGRQDASYGLHLEIDNEGVKSTLNLQESGFFIRGEVRHIEPVKTENDSLILVVRNNEHVQFFVPTK